MRCEMNVAVEAIQSVDCAAKGGEETAVKVLTPVRRHDDVRGALHGEPMGEAIDFGVRDVPALTHG